MDSFQKIFTQDIYTHQPDFLSIHTTHDASSFFGKNTIHTFRGHHLAKRVLTLALLDYNQRIDQLPERYYVQEANLVLKMALTYAPPSFNLRLTTTHSKTPFCNSVKSTRNTGTRAGGDPFNLCSQSRLFFTEERILRMPYLLSAAKPSLLKVMQKDNFFFLIFYFGSVKWLDAFR